MSYTNLTGTSIRYASVRGANLDGIAARRNTERLLAQMHEAVPGMSESAVLCVRELSVHVRSRARYMQSGSSVMDAEMERLARNAARPALGPVPANAEAVVFADKAELLSCLARDYVHHLLLQGWWWRVLLPGPSLAVAAMQMWVEEAAHVPAALARLARTRDAVAFVRKLGDDEASAVAQAMVHAHGLALLAEDGAVTPFLQSQSQLISPSLSNSHHVDALTALQQRERDIRDALPEAWAPGLSMPQRRLLALGLSLVRMPGLVRGSAYAQVLPVLLKQAHFSMSRAVIEVREFALGESLQDPSLSASLPAVVPSPAGGSRSGIGLAKPGDTNKFDTGHAKNLLTDEKISLLELPVAKRDDVEPIKNTSPDKYASEVSASLLVGNTQVVETEFGGVFFLCNAALALDLYADFTRPLDHGLELSFWDFLALAAVDLGGPAVRRDPLWPLLAELAGRKPGKRLGADFVPPNEWRMPTDWLLPFASDVGDWQWEADITRLRVHHSAGFVVFDVLRNEMAVKAQLQLEMAPYAVPVLTQLAIIQCKQITAFARWRGWLMPYLGRRVARALGEVHWRRACRQLLNLPGRIECDAERLAVYFSLEQLPIAVRIAGLDRDPGWIPAAGREVRFYFGCDDA